MTDSTVPTGKRKDAARDTDRNAGSAGSIAGKVRRRRVPGLDAAVGRATSGVKGVAGGARRASSTAGRTAAETGRTAGGGVAGAGRTVASGTGAVVEKGTGTVQGTVGAVSSVVRTGLGTSLWFLVSKALILLQLIKRLALMALDVIERLAQRVRERAATRHER